MTNQSTLEGIRSAATFLRRELRPRLALRHTPFLTFALDESIEEANHLLGIMDSIRDNQPDDALPEKHDRSAGPLTFPTAAS